MRWHQKEIDSVIEDLGTSLQGLSSEKAKKRFEEYGPNELKEGKKKSPLGMFLDQFKDFMIIVLMASAVIAGALGEVADTIAIVVIVVINAVIGFVQEYRAEKAMEALKMMAAPTATVLRDGHASNIASSDVVPGDVVLLEAGRVVPADLRLIESAQLKVEEAALTGESVPVEKHTASLHDETIPLGDRKNMTYKGTIVSYGRGKGIAVSTGMETEIGRIATMLQTEEEAKTPLQKRLMAFGQRLAIAVLIICAIVFGIGIMRGESPLLMLLTAISLAVAAIPEALPAVVTISLALGARKMVKQNALIRKLPAVETLGSVTYICTDKTGTLTLNKMTAEEIYVDGKFVGADLRVCPKEGEHRGSPLQSLMTAMALSNDATSDASGNVIGDPTEVALYMAAEKAGLKKTILEKDNERISEIPFDSDRKMMTTFHKIPLAPPFSKGDFSGFPPLAKGGEGGFVSFTKGGVEIILDRSINILTSEGIKDIKRDAII
ncbi:MAG: HAD-IC family P-type ATPase, partial [Deltaproteobacteria bacterium]|nr:HAD-IC family P-type ATPase [Deltaproteobacteria bacterium]